MKITDKAQGTQISIYLRADEVRAIGQILDAQWKSENPPYKESALTRHRIVKFALRRFLFPNEKLVPLNGMAIEMRNGAPYMKHKDPCPHELIIDEDEEIEFTE